MSFTRKQKSLLLFPLSVDMTDDEKCQYCEDHTYESHHNGYALPFTYKETENMEGYQYVPQFLFQRLGLN